MNDYCLLLNTDIPPLKEGVVITNQLEHHRQLSMDIVNPDLLAWLDSLDIVLADFVEVFHWKQGESGGLHVDHHEGDFVKLNYVYGGDGSSTNWYQKKDPAPKQAVQTVINSTTFFYKFDEVEKIHSEHVVGPCILQVGIPHQVVNGNIEGRHTLCFVPQFKDGSFISMAQAQEIFSSYIKE